MRKLFLGIFCISLVVSSCDDGDIITLELDFDKSLELCGDENTENYVVFDTKEDPFESLTFLFQSNNTNAKIFNPDTTPYMTSLSINGTSRRFNYRVYNGDPSGLICEDIPDSNVSITEDYESTSGTVEIIATYIDDDNDTIPTELEDANTDGDNDPETNPTDSDGDTIPDYKDADDDNDNVLTKDENPDPDGDGDLSDAQDTDSDGTPDYLDSDDDNDGTITRYEDANSNGNLFDDFEVGAIVPRFLDDSVSDVFVNDNLNANTFIRTVTTDFTAMNINIEILSADALFLGTYINSITF
jgi:hypothetical protein